MESSWKVSLHGGHSGPFCEHARGELHEILEAAVAAGYRTFGVSEHAPRLGERFLYPEEVAKGWTVERLAEDFDAYCFSVANLARQFEGRLEVLCGFEAEVVPSDRYVSIMLDLQRKGRLDYMVGSVHYVEELQIDGAPAAFEAAARRVGGLEKLAVRYYETVARMVRELQPEVVGHFDLIRKNAGPRTPLDTPPIRAAALQALEAAREYDCILDVNTAGYRKGLGAPYPAPWLVREAVAMGLGFCFGDDSHSPKEVGMDLERARHYLLEHGVTSLTVLTRNGDRLARRTTALSDPPQEAG